MLISIRVHSISVHLDDSLYYYSNMNAIKTYRHYVKEIRRWTISVDVIQTSTYIEICDDHKGG
jgi:hypothetical protein